MATETRLTAASAPKYGFGTGALLTSVGFILGTLVMALLTDQGLLYSSGIPTDEAYLRAEHFYLTLWTSPLAFKALFHVFLLVPIFTLCIKVAKYTEAALYFDGVCLAFCLLIIGLYTGSTIPNIRKIASTPSTDELVLLVNSSASQLGNALGTEFDPSSPISFFNRFLVLLSYPSTILMKASKVAEAAEAFQETLKADPITTEKRKELLSVTAAGHSIAIFLLVGILVLQLGKVYAENEDARLKAEFALEEEKKKNAVPLEKKSQ
ncbi:hypothetical protein DFH28DRAFT_932460 [Melampsora americana]|nr:hypothetical protein DFH28DRAFT_932460 [Melampsora americana]